MIKRVDEIDALLKEAVEIRKQLNPDVKPVFTARKQPLGDMGPAIPNIAIINRLQEIDDRLLELGASIED
ncbi:hypothetical protein ACU8MB_08900 [Rhizobium leguminosarum]